MKKNDLSHDFACKADFVVAFKNNLTDMVFSLAALSINWLRMNVCIVCTQAILKDASFFLSFKQLIEPARHNKRCNSETISYLDTFISFITGVHFKEVIQSPKESDFNDLCLISFQLFNGFWSPNAYYIANKNINTCLLLLFLLKLPSCLFLAGKFSCKK